MLVISRRHYLQTVLGLSGGTLLTGCAKRLATVDYDYVLELKPTDLTLIPGTQTPAWTFNGQFPGPELRVKQNRPVRILVKNLLPEATTIHWHGIRLNNAADGVPGLTQQPIQPGATFIYEFTCPDAGTFWYHPHFNSLEQLSRGLMGLLVVEESKPLKFDEEHSLVLKDWHLNADGSFGPFTSHRAAARVGTLGNFPTVNGKPSETLKIPANSSVRLRIGNVDNTRVFNIGTDFPSEVISVEGNPLAKPYNLDNHPLGPGMRLDVAFIAPAKPGQYHLVDRKGKFAFPICTLDVQANTQTPSALPQLPINPIPAPDLTRATRILLVFEWAGALSPTKADGNIDPTFWTINKRAWADHSHQHLPEPLATLKLGQSYIFELINATPHEHPIHMHGFTFTVLKSNQREITPYHTDTVLLAKNEHVEVAILADNPGNWMFHCHVIEHMATGLMGYIRVES
jgi:FtsP/CotA-like multicopper oxidase with cupredoxin domain